MMSFISDSSNADFIDVLTRFAVNAFVILILIGGLYKKTEENKEYVFPLVIIGIIIFLLSSYLSIVRVELGIALGLFAIFSIIRFRTRNMQAYQMAYLFTIIGTSAINALALFPHLLRGMFLSNMLIITSVIVLEYYNHRTINQKQEISFSNLELIKPSNRSELIEHLKQITELDIQKITVKEVSYIKREAKITIYYKK
ncbi:DUF4956 domain-containing protein [Carboxylicivirga marina]|uniref:DUF4956 domain-containing protein n=1 Tax=Carboxylicivirga marina TaxID=2800988 RepID=A0ABS1HLM6_9BACT|nr:DUF4956 domain-containing protein [Carboxylicivirga marina]MBK3518571.1 DUF4956 domain-containing protein [Carboxylicivirga marina]